MTGDVVEIEGAGGEHADTGRIMGRGPFVLGRDHDPGLAFEVGGGEIRGIGAGPQVAGAPVAGGVGQGHARHGAAVIAGEFLPLDPHEELGMAVFLAQSLGAEADIDAEARAFRG